jgi:hypothetical protein
MQTKTAIARETPQAMAVFLYCPENAVVPADIHTNERLQGRHSSHAYILPHFTAKFNEHNLQNLPYKIS